MERKVIKREKTIAELPSFTRAAAYARVSSGKDEMLHSLAAQVSYYSAYIQQQPGWVYIGVYTDEAFTGTKDNRPEFRRLIEDCRGGKIDLVLTKSISRFARNTVDLLETVRELKALGVDVFFEEQNIHTMSGDGELMLTILASYAQEESRSVSENCKWRIRKQFENGELACLRFMFGYQIDKDKIEVDPVQAATVRMVFEDYINGMGGSRIAKKLIEMNVSAIHSGVWNSDRVIALLRNEKYTGNALLQKRYVVDHLTKKPVLNKGNLPMYYAEDTHPAIIDTETFERAQVVLEERRLISRTNNDTHARYPLSGTIQCGICGKKYKRKINGRKLTWQCSTFLKGGKGVCSAKQIPEDVLYQASAEVLGLEEFDAESFKKEILEILVPAFGKLMFVFRDGRTTLKDWKYRSRRESWTDEMREAVREKAKGGV